MKSILTFSRVFQGAEVETGLERWVRKKRLQRAWCDSFLEGMVTMPPANPVVSQRIVEAAANLFARQGYHGTSTREIARLAEVSENTLFRHFPKKEDVFWSALRSRTALLPQLDIPDDLRAGEAPEVVLPKIIQALNEIAGNKPEVLRLIAVACVELQGNAEEKCRELLSPILSSVSSYLASSVRRGQFVDVDPSMLAASLTAMVILHPQLRKLNAAEIQTTPDSGNSTDAYTKFWLSMLTPRPPRSAAFI